MAQYTILTQHNIQAILTNYNLSTIAHWEALKGGSENTNYLINTPNQQYVLTICEQMTRQRAIELTHLLEYLVNTGFATSKVIRNAQQQPIEQWQGKPVILKEYLVGQVKEYLPSHLLEKVGQQLGKLHQLQAPGYLPDCINYGLQAFKEMETYAPHSKFHKWLQGIHQYIHQYNLSELPKALIHSDLFYNNIIISPDGQEAMIMDFEEASYYYRVFDVGMTITGVCCHNTSIDLAEAKSFLTGYLQTNELLKEEMKALKAFVVYAAAATAFWRYRQFNVLNPDPALEGHYKTMQQLADEVRVLPDDCFSSTVN